MIPYAKGFNFHTKCPGQSVQLFIVHCDVYYHIYNQFHDLEVAYGVGPISS